jgi:NAD(P)-dependent dehydrogenase (short-subunit alcohol dehydrogenase family)
MKEQKTMQNPNKRVALVTGANKGIGFEIAKKLAAQKITVLIGSRNQEYGVNAQDKLRRH